MKKVEVVAAVIFKDGKVLATQRGYGEFKGGWEFPGGKMEQNESLSQALKREIKEELDTEIEVKDLIMTVEYDYPNFHLTMHCFKCELIGKNPTLLEHEDARWVNKSEIDNLNWLPADLELLEQIKLMKDID